MSKIKDKKNNFMQKIERLVAPLSKVGSQKHLSAMRDGFAMTLPFTIAGAIAILFITIVFGGWGAEKTSLIGWLAHASGKTVVNHTNLFNNDSSWEMIGKFKEAAVFGQTIFGWINAASLGKISIFVALFLGFSMGNIRRIKSPILASAFSLSIFFVLTGGNQDLFGTSGMLTAIIAGLAGTEVYALIVNSKKLELKLPPSVPPAVGRSFGVLLPGFAALAIFSGLNIIVSVPYLAILGKEITSGGQFFNFSQIINTVILQPFMLFAKSGGDIAILEVYVLFVGFFWFFGLHGPNTLGAAFGPISLLLWIDNMNGANNVAMEQVWSGFGFLGGSGGTLMLVILSLLLLSKASPVREVSKFALPAAVFEINEPVIFGFPITFNIVYLIPFIFAVPISILWPILAIKTGWMNAPTLLAPWTTPPIIYGLIVTQFDPRSIIVSLLVIITQILIWLPFVLWQRKIDKNELNIDGKSVWNEWVEKFKNRKKAAVSNA